LGGHENVKTELAYFIMTITFSQLCVLYLSHTYRDSINWLAEGIHNLPV